MAASLQPTWPQRGLKAEGRSVGDMRFCRGIRVALRPPLQTAPWTAQGPTSHQFCEPLPQESGGPLSLTGTRKELSCHCRWSSGCKGTSALLPLLPVLTLSEDFCPTQWPIVPETSEPQSPCPSQAVATALSHFTITIGHRSTNRGPPGSLAGHTEFSIS